MKQLVKKDIRYINQKPKLVLSVCYKNSNNEVLFVHIAVNVRSKHSYSRKMYTEHYSSQQNSAETVQIKLGYRLKSSTQNYHHKVASV